MGIFSILPANLSAVETWLTRLFLLLAFICMGPWIALLVYDALLYLFRTVTHEIPLVGGRARGKARPRAPSLTERPSGHRRRFSLTAARRPQLSTESIGGEKLDSSARLRHIKEELDRDPSTP